MNSFNVLSKILVYSFLSFLLLGDCEILCSQQFINGRLISDKPEVMYSRCFRTLAKDLNANPDSVFKPDPYYEVCLYKKSDILGLDSLAHRQAILFEISLIADLNYPSNWLADTPHAVLVSHNYIKGSDIGISLELNAPLIKDSIYILSFSATNNRWFMGIEEFFGEDSVPLFDYRMAITQSSVPHSEGDTIAMVNIRNRSERDYKSCFPVITQTNRSPCGKVGDFYWYRIKVKGANSGRYITFKSSLEMPEEKLKEYFRKTSNPNFYLEKWWEYYITQYWGMYMTKFSISSVFQILEKGSLCDKSNPKILSCSSNHYTDKYKWSTGDTSPTIQISEPGMYWLEKERQGAVWVDTIYIDTVAVKVLQTVSEKICDMDSIQLGLNVSDKQSKFIWNTSDTSSSIIVSKPGLYLRYSDYAGCPALDSFLISRYPRHKALESKYIKVCESDSTELYSFCENLNWFKGDSLLSESKRFRILLRQNDTLLLKSLSKCWQYDTIYIDLMPCHQNLEDLVFIPGSFSPNGDGLNDYYSIQSPFIQSGEFLIYNRWGELIFKTDHIEDGWDGKAFGVEVPDGIYLVYFKLDINLTLDGLPTTKYFLKTLNVLR